MRQTLTNIYDSIQSNSKKPINVTRSINNIACKTPDNKYTIYLTLSDTQSRGKVIQGKGNNVNDAISNALTKYLNHKSNTFKPHAVKLDIVTSIKPAKKIDKEYHFSKVKVLFDQGGDGIALDQSLNYSLLPGEVTGYRIFRRKKFVKERVLQAFDNHLPSNKTAFIERLNDSKKFFLYKFKTKTFYIDNENILQLTRDHRTFDELTSNDLWDAIKLTKDHYFKHVVNDKGKFIYSYLPYINKKQKRYNILRHAGTIYSMLETYELMPDKELLEKAKIAIRFLLNKIKPLQVNGREVKVVVEKDAQKIGGNALTIIALAKYTNVTNDSQYVPVMQDLAAWLMEVQDHKGEFSVHKQRYSTGEKFDFISHFYPGEAILSLVRLYQIDKNETWLDVAEKAADFLINIRDKNDTIDTIALDHWLLYGLNELYRERKNNTYLKHSFFIAEAMMKKQITKDNAPRKELIGGYFPKKGGEPKSTPTACRSEGLGATYRLAKDFGHDELANRIKVAIDLGIKFQLQTQLRLESTMYYDNKNLCLGAIQSGLKSFSLRIDFTQHNISSFISYYKILENEK